MNKKEEENILTPKLMIDHKDYDMTSSCHCNTVKVLNIWERYAMMEQDTTPEVLINEDVFLNDEIDLDSDMTPVFGLNIKGEIIINK